MTIYPSIDSVYNQELWHLKPVKPFLKWAGGKRQLIPELMAQRPKTFNKYIEPFAGGAALFFQLRPNQAILADLNPELINCYCVVRDNVDDLIKELEGYINDENFYYLIRSIELNKLTDIQRAARFIYLNKTSFNGLYRVNKLGQFNVPFGHRVNPTICDRKVLREANEALQGVHLIHSDYQAVLQKFAEPGDFIFLDPPYHPVGEYSDFNRFTKEKFYDEDQIDLRNEFIRLVEMGCYVLLTNSNTNFIKSLYKNFEYQIIDTKRNISSNASTRIGQDLLVIATKSQKQISERISPPEKFLENFPGTRYMGSKYRILPFLWDCIKDLNFSSVLDAFSGSSCVSYLLKQQGKTVISNDFMHFPYYFSKALIENHNVQLEADDVGFLLQKNPNADSFIADTFAGLYFSDDDNHFLDNLRANIELLGNDYKKALALAAISRACMKRRARGIFTYVGNRYEDGRRDLQIDLQQHFIENVAAFNMAVFDNGKKNLAFNSDIFDLDIQADLVYFDPPYYTPNSDNDYTRRYHFVEGLVRRWDGLKIMQNTKTKKFKRYETPFLSRDTIYSAFQRLFEKYRKSIIVVSYSSNSIPDKGTLMDLLKETKKSVSVYQIDHLYSFGNQYIAEENANRVNEYVFIAQ